MRLFLLLIFLCSCASPTASIIFSENKVDFNIGKSGKVYYKDKDKEAYLDTQSPSILRTAIEGGLMREMDKD